MPTATLSRVRQFCDIAMGTIPQAFKQLRNLPDQHAARAGAADGRFVQPPTTMRLMATDAPGVLADSDRRLGPCHNISISAVLHSANPKSEPNANPKFGCAGCDHKTIRPEKASWRAMKGDRAASRQSHTPGRECCALRDH